MAERGPKSLQLKVLWCFFFFFLTKLHHLCVLGARLSWHRLGEMWQGERALCNEGSSVHAQKLRESKQLSCIFSLDAMRPLRFFFFSLSLHSITHVHSDSGTHTAVPNTLQAKCEACRWFTFLSLWSRHDSLRPFTKIKRFFCITHRFRWYFAFFYLTPPSKSMSLQLPSKSHIFL